MESKQDETKTNSTSGEAEERIGEASGAACRVSQLSAYIRCHNAAAAIRFYKETFGATEVVRLTEPSERIAHAELKIGPATLMVSDEYPEDGIMSPTSLDGTSFAIYTQVDDVEQVFEAALSRGATSLMEPRDQFYGERAAKIRDPWGHEWLLGQQLEALSAVELQERFETLMKKE